MTWLAEWEARNSIQDTSLLPSMVCTSFGMDDGSKARLSEEGAGRPPEERQDRQLQFVISGTNASSLRKPQNDVPISRTTWRAPAHYWKSKVIPTPTGDVHRVGIEHRADGWRGPTGSVDDATDRGVQARHSEGNMLGACVFLNEQRPWEDGAEKTFGFTRFGPDPGWGLPRRTTRPRPNFRCGIPRVWYWQKDGAYP